MTRQELLNLVVMDNEYTQEQLASAINSVLPQLQELDSFSKFWQSGEEFASEVEANTVTMLDVDYYGNYDFNGYEVDAYPLEGKEVVTLEVFINAIKTFFEI